MQPVDVTIQGQALNSFGLTAHNTISGVGLNTFGFLWPCSDIWSTSEAAITTTWVSSIDASTVEVCSD